MIEVRHVRDLDLEARPGEVGFVSAASGLVRAWRFLHVIADDDFGLASFDVDEPGAGRIRPLLAGQLPDQPAERKRMKPDFEALAMLPSTACHPHGALLAFGSGSRPTRRHAVLIHLAPTGAAGDHILLDLAWLYNGLEPSFAELNIEGAVTCGDRMLLFQRDATGRDTAIISYPLGGFLAALSLSAAVPTPQILPTDLGRVGGVALSFTDAATLGDAVVFSAVAEATGNAYDDGPLVAAAIGVIEVGGKVRRLEPLSQKIKIEGIWATVDGANIDLLMAADADDPSRPAGLYAARLTGWMAIS